MHSFVTTIDSLLADWSKRLFGGLAERHAVGSITWAQVGIVVLFLLLALLANGIAAAVVRWRFKRSETPGGAPPTHRFAGAVGKPLYTLIWAYGVYFAISPALLALKSVSAAQTLLRVLDTALDLATFAVIVWFVYRSTRVLETRLERWASRSHSVLDKLLVPLIGRSSRVLVPVLGIIIALPSVGLPARYAALASKGSAILLVVAFAWVLMQAARVGESALMTRFDIKASDNLQARKIYTQVRVLGKVTDIAIGLLATASVLMMFAEVRRLGASLLASAGIVGIIAGIAAQKTLANLLAGFQIALAQPMRLDDVVIVEGSWGRIEEITLTYVVVHVWDDTRLIVPLTYFIENPFQNWTRTSAGLLGQVHLWVDYTFPVDEGRTALKQIVEGSDLWDKRFWNLQVVEASEKSMQLRVLATAVDSSTAWSLRCEIREKFIAYIQAHYPACLPQLRTELHGLPLSDARAGGALSSAESKNTGGST